MIPSDSKSPLDALKSLVGTALHDINNLLLVISCSNSKLLEQISDDAPATETAAAIIAASDRIAEITRRLQRDLSEIRPSDTVAPQPVPRFESPTVGGETVLLVDDDSQVRQFLKTALLRGGYQVLDARHGPAAIAIAMRHTGSIDLLVTDMLMPEMSGQELADSLRTVTPDLPVLYLSGMDSSHQMASTPKNCDTFVQKPFRLPELLSKIREILDN